MDGWRVSKQGVCVLGGVVCGCVYLAAEGEVELLQRGAAELDEGHEGRVRQGGWVCVGAHQLMNIHMSVPSHKECKAKQSKQPYPRRSRRGA